MGDALSVPFIVSWFEISRDHFDFFDFFFNFFEEERIVILALPVFEPTHLCDPSWKCKLMSFSFRKIPSFLFLDFQKESTSFVTGTFPPQYIGVTGENF